MAISGNVPNHLVVGAKTGLLYTPPNDQLPYRLVATVFDQTEKTSTRVDLGGMPTLTQNPYQVDTLVERSKTITPEDWYLTLTITRNAVNDDQTGGLLTRFKNVMPAFERHINSRVFTVLNAGDAATYGTGITAASTFFADSHLYPGGKNTTGQDNKYALNLSLDNFNTVWVAAQGFKDDAGNYNNHNFNLLVVNQSNNVTAANITGNVQAMDTGNREMNPYSGRVSYITAPEFDTNAWVLVAGSESAKPLYVAIKQRMMLTESSFDGNTEGGGTYKFVYHARYVVGYGDPLLAIMGQT